MQKKQGLVTFSIAMFVLVGVIFRPSFLMGGIVFFTNPQIALEQMLNYNSQNTVLAPVPTPMPVFSPSPSIAPSHSPTPFTGDLLGEIELIPDTGKPDGTGDVIEKTYPIGIGEQYIQVGAGSIQNLTNNANDVLAQAISNGKAFEIEQNSAEPQVLIMHTHATETYRLYEGLYYDLSDTARTTDKTLDVCAVGAIITQTLNEAGINTLHDTSLNDYPSYNASYDNSREVVQAYLEQYPSIKVVIDVHRDALEARGARYAPVAEINGKQSAQVMIISGCENGSTVNLPNWEQNLAFAAEWETQMEADSPGLTRSAMCSYKFYNQDLTTGSLLLEVGGHGNTLNEALYAGKLAAESLAEVLLN